MNRIDLLARLAEQARPRDRWRKMAMAHLGEIREARLAGYTWRAITGALGCEPSEWRRLYRACKKIGAEFGTRLYETEDAV